MSEARDLTPMTSEVVPKQSIEGLRARTALTQRTEHLKVTSLLQPIRLGETFHHQLLQSFRNIRRVVHAHEVTVSVVDLVRKDRHLARFDLIRNPGYPARTPLKNHFVELHRGHDLRIDEIGKEHAGADGRQEVPVAHKENGGTRRQGRKQPVRRRDVEHGGITHDEQIAVNGVLDIALEHALRNVVFEKLPNAFHLA